MTKYKYKKLNKGGHIGSVVGTGIGAAVGNVIPGAGTLVGAQIGGMLGGSVGSLLNRKRQERTPVPVTTPLYKYGGKTNKKTMSKVKIKKYPTGGRLPITQPIGQGAVKYQGPQHEQGGIPIGETGQINQTNPVAEVEGGETRQGDIIFSDELIVPGTEMTFAEAHELLLQEGAGEEEIQQLAQLQQQAQQEQGISPQGEMGEAGQMMNHGGKYDKGWGEEGMFAKGGKLKYAYGANLRENNIPYRNIHLSRDEKLAKTRNPNITSPAFTSSPRDAQGVIDSTPSIEKESKIGRGVQQFLPSAVKLGVAALAPRPKPTPRMSTEQRTLQSGVFADARRNVGGGFRSTRRGQGEYARYIEGMSNIAAQEAGHRQGVEDQNIQSRDSARQFNIQAQIRDEDLKAQDTARRLGLVTQAVTEPLAMRQAEKSERRSTMRDLILASYQIPDAKERSEWLKQATRNLKYGGKLKRRKTK